jgi:DNA replication protein DnaC
MTPLDSKLAQLKLGRIAQVYSSWIEHAITTGMSHAEFLEELVNEEVLARQENQVRRRLQHARFPFAATIEQFDFAVRPELKRSVMLRYFDSSFVTETKSLLLIGPSGTGKTHLAIAVGTKMAQLGYTVRFLTAQVLANAVLSTADRCSLATFLHPLLTCDVLILDEFGYLPPEPALGPVLFEIVAHRYQQGAMVITSNKSLPTWGEVIGDTTLMMALLDRLLHHGEVFYLRGASYRLRGKEVVTTAFTESGMTSAPPQGDR